MTKLKFNSDQEAFWASKFGDEYISRNESPQLLASNINFFARALRATAGLNSCIEFGANIGMNLRALQLLYPDCKLEGVEINETAATQLSNLIGEKNVFRGSIVDYKPRGVFDLVLIKGVLIHINPELLPEVYDRLFQSAGSYILLCEYYNPIPVAIPYRGHVDRLFKRDFAGELMERFIHLKLVDYGFAYRRDPVFPQDDITWFLMEKKAG